MASVNLGGHILVGVSPLVQNVGEAGPKSIHRNAAGWKNSVRGKSDRSLRVGGDFIPVPVCTIYANLVQECGREGVVPDRRKRLIDLVMVEDVVATVAVESIFREGNPVDGESDLILAGNIRVQAAIVLGSRKFGWVDRVVIRKVGHGTQRAASSSAACARPPAAGIRGTRPSKILLTQARR